MSQIEDRTQNRRGLVKVQDMQEFRQASVERVMTQLQEILFLFDKLFDSPENDTKRLFVITQTDSFINRKILDLNKDDELFSSDNAVIYMSAGDRDVIVWKKPQTANKLYNDIANELVDKMIVDADWQHFTQGLYILHILTHRYKNGNGRTARAIRLICTKLQARQLSISDKELAEVLGLNKDRITQLSQTRFRIETSPDFNVLMYGVAYFALKKRISVQEINDVIMHLMPEETIDFLSEKLKIPYDKLKKEFVNFMVFEFKPENVDN